MDKIDIFLITITGAASFAVLYLVWLLWSG